MPRSADSNIRSEKSKLISNITVRATLQQILNLVGFFSLREEITAAFWSSEEAMAPRLE